MVETFASTYSRAEWTALTVSLKAFIAEKAGTVVAAISRASPVFGLRPVLFALALGSKAPKPTKGYLPPIGDGLNNGA